VAGKLVALLANAGVAVPDWLEKPGLEVVVMREMEELGVATMQMTGINLESFVS